MEEESINIRDYIQVLFRRKYIILLVFIVFLPFIVMKALSYSPVYKAATKLFIQKNHDPQLTTNQWFRYDPAFLPTQVQIITSSKVGEKVVRNMNLVETYRDYFPEEVSNPSFLSSTMESFDRIYQMGLQMAGLKSGPSDFVHQHPLSEEELTEQRIKALSIMVSNNISVKISGENSDIVEVSYISPNPLFAQHIVNNVSSAYRLFLLEMQMESTGETIEWMKTNAAAQREKLEDSERVLQNYTKEHNLYMSGDSEALLPAQISDFSMRLTHALAEVNELESLYQAISRISSQEALNIPVISENEIIRALRRSVIEKEQEINELSRKIGDRHPQMIRAREDLLALQGRLNEEIQTVIQSVKNKYELAGERARNIELLLNQTKYDAGTMSDVLFQYEILNRDVEVNRLLYDRLISRIKEYGATENKQSIDVWVVETAEVPRSPMHQGPKRTILIGLLASLMAGVGLAFFLEHLDNTVKTAEDAEARLDLPVAGMIPLFNDKSLNVEKIAHLLPHSVIAERYRAIRTLILLSDDIPKPYTLLITSMVEQTGKTVTASNLAISMAQSERRVLLVDADMRRPKVHKTFGVDNTSGLSTYLSGESEFTPMTVEEIKFLHILPSGPIPKNPAELLSSARLKELIRETGPDYDFIVFDSPPMADVTDAVLIAKIANYNLLVVRSGVSTYESIKQADKVFKSINANVLGQVINAVNERKHDYYHYKYYGTKGNYYAQSPFS